MTASANPAPQPRLPLWVKAAYGFTDTGINVFVIFKGLLVLQFLVKFVKVDPFVAGLVTSSVLVIDIITDPIMGRISDATPGRFGRRHPYLFLGAPLMALFIIITFMVPAGMVGTAAAAWVFVFFVLGSIAFTMVVIPLGALSVEITNSPKERSTMTAWRMASASLGILLAGAVFPILIGMMGHTMAAIVFAPIVVVTIWIGTFATYPFRVSEPPVSMPYMDQIRLAWKNHRFVALVIIYGVQTLGISIITAGIPFAADDLIRVTDSSVVKGLYVLGAFSTMFALFVLGSMVSQPIWALLSSRLGKGTTFMVGIGLYVVVLVAFYFVLPSAAMLNSGITNLGLITIFIFLVGVSNGCYQQLPWAIMPDLVDYSNDQGEEAVAGVFSGLWLLGQKIGNALGPLLIGAVLSAYGFIETAAGEVVTQPDAAIDALRWSMTLVPAVLMAVSIPLYIWWDARAKAAQAAH